MKASEKLAFLFMSTKNPKLKTKHSKSLFKYYAGFSDDFVISAIHKEHTLSDQDRFIVLDPWNGSGTTTHACNKLGIPSVGVDRNPAMAILAMAREASIDSIQKIRTLSPIECTIDKDDPLLIWFMPSSAKYIRAIESAIRSIACHQTQALGYVILFNTTKSLLKKYQTTNPTWIKKPESKNRVRPSPEKIKSEFDDLCKKLDLEKNSKHSKASKSLIITSDSRSLPLAEKSIDLTITSPPYCTRIDYAIATSIELSILSYSQKSFSEIREALIGSTTVTNGITTNKKWGKICCDTLEKIRTHPSKASNGYYTKNFLRYFDSLFESICEITRVTKNNGKCYMVIQDSYYKEVHIDLPLIASEMFYSNGWQLEARQDFISSRNKATINSKSSKYQTKKIATESVLTLRKRT